MTSPTILEANLGPTFNTQVCWNRASTLRIDLTLTWGTCRVWQLNLRHEKLFCWFDMNFKQKNRLDFISVAYVNNMACIWRVCLRPFASGQMSVCYSVWQDTDTRRCLTQLGHEGMEVDVCHQVHVLAPCTRCWLCRQLKGGRTVIPERTHENTHTHLWKGLPEAHTHTHWHNRNNTSLSVLTPEHKCCDTNMHTHLCKLSHTSSPSLGPLDYLPIWLQPLSPLHN